MKNQLEAILKQDMTRKEFLQYIGVALLAAFGVTNLLKHLLQTKPAQPTQMGYGSSAYGGADKKGL